MEVPFHLFFGLSDSFGIEVKKVGGDKFNEFCKVIIRSQAMTKGYELFCQTNPFELRLDVDEERWLWWKLMGRKSKHNKVQHLRRISEYNQNHKGRVCIRCGVEIIEATHHHMCTRCWYLNGTGTK